MIDKQSVKNEKSERLYEVDGKQMPYEQFMEMFNNPKIKIKEIAPFVYKTLERMFG